MENILNQLKQMVIDQNALVETLESEILNVMKSTRNDFTEESCERLASLIGKKNSEFQKARCLRHALVSLREAAGHKDVDVFYPERF